MHVYSSISGWPLVLISQCSSYDAFLGPYLSSIFEEKSLRDTNYQYYLSRGICNDALNQ